MSESLKSAVRTAVLRLLTPLASWLLEAGMGVGDFITLVKIAFVKAAMAQDRAAGRDRSSTSRIAVVTGLTRVEVARIVAGESKERPHDLGRRQRAERVLSGWWSDAAFLDPSGEPAALAVRGSKASFATLVERYSGERASAAAILSELLRVKAVRRLPNGKLKALSRTYATVRWDQEGVIAFGDHMAALCSTLLHNLNSPERANYVRKIQNNQLDARYVPMLRRDLEQQLEVMIDSVDDRWNHPTHSAEDKSPPVSRKGLGMVVFVFDPEESHDPPDEKSEVLAPAAHSASRKAGRPLTIRGAAR